ncbi:MAG: hypothetical protein ACE5KD_03630, partial [Candidatus Bathyarchaeia archaeon]
INVTVENQGNYTETFVVAAYGNTTLIDIPTLTTLTIENSTVVTFAWNTTSFDRGNYTISAYAWPVLGENDTDDNTMIDGWVLVTLSGDVDGDRDVDIFDIVRIANSYNTKEGDLGYDPNVDIDGDGDIDIFDIVIAAGNYREHW